MTSAERSRRHRQAKRDGQTLTGTTVKQSAKSFHISERQLYYGRFVTRYGVPEWNDLIMGEKHRISIAWAAAVCRYTDHETQRELIKIIEKDGIKFARRVWAQAKEQMR